MSPGTRRALWLVLFTLLAIGAAVAAPLWLRGEAFVGATWRDREWLFGLIAVPLVFYWGTFGQDRRKPLLRVGTIAPFMTGPRGWRSHLRDFPGILRAISVALLFGAMARPVSVLADTKGEESGIDIMVVLDLSLSMQAVMSADAQSFPGSENAPKGRPLTRLDTAKLVINDFIGRRKSDRMGVVVFGKTAYILSPPTLDYALLTQLVSKMSLHVVDGTGTAIGDALGTAVARLRRGDARSKVIVLLTDGDSNAGSVAPEYAAELAVQHGAKVYTIQIGNEDEAYVYEGDDWLGQPRYSKQRFPVNPELLKRIAEKTGGKTYIATDAQGLSASMHAVLDQLEKTKFEAASSSFEDLFPFLLIPGVLLVGLDALLRALVLRRFP